MTNTQTQRKQFLADPSALLATEGIDRADSERLKSLHREYQDKKKVLKKLKTEKGSLSREIGRQKKEGIDISAILEQVDAVSRTLDLESQTFKKLEREILSFLPAPGGGTDSTENPPSLPASTRRYSDRGDRAQHYEIQELDDDTESWDRFVQKTAGASIYHLSRWRGLIERCFGHQSHYLCARSHESGELVGILPLLRLKSRLFGDFLVSVPYFNYGGALAVSPDIEIGLMNYAADLAGKLGVEHIEFRDEMPRTDWQARTDKVAMILPLPETEQALSNNLGSKLRAQIKRPQKEGLQTQVGGAELLDEFYHVFSINMRDLGTPVYSKSFFREILQAFAEESRIVIVRHLGQPVACGFLLGYGPTLEIPWASTLRSANKLSANMLLYWEVLRFAVGRYQYFDFGRSSKDSGTYRFKKQWGAIEKQLYWHYWLSGGGDLPMMNPNNPKFRLLIAVWKRLPVVLANSIGPLVVKNLP